MQCEVCKEQDATVHLTQVIDGSVKKMHLCEDCAAKSGVDPKDGVSLTDLLLGLGQIVTGPEGIPLAEKSCPHCHLRQADFKKGGRLGCPDCYEAFAAELEPLIHAMHRRDRHAGKVPRAMAAAAGVAEGLERLQRELAKAIEKEDYERAAMLRDRIQGLRKATPSVGTSAP